MSDFWRVGVGAGVGRGRWQTGLQNRIRTAYSASGCLEGAASANGGNTLQAASMRVSVG